MGDISRHRDIYFNTRDAVPPDLLAACKLTAGDLTYLELGNYLTDVSQFRDPVTYIFAKQKIWRERIIPQVADKSGLLRGLTALAGNAAAAALLARGRPKNAAIGAAVGLLPALVSNEMLAGIFGLDDWIDRMFGKPIERSPANRRQRRDEEYGLVGQFFQHFIEGITHLLFAQEIANKVTGDWGQIDRIPELSVTSVFEKFFTQYFPHEHTDQPPYVWDASERSKEPKWYAPSNRQRESSGEGGGVMNAVDEHYVRYLAEGLSKLEVEWRAIKPADIEARRMLLVRLGKILHGVEDWYFHSNVVELIRIRGHQPAQRADEDGEHFARRFSKEGLKDEPAVSASEERDRTSVERRLQRRLYRRLRFPLYERGTRANSAGVASRRQSSLSLDHAYTAFPSQQDTAHTLLSALENLERKGRGSTGGQTELPAWAPFVLGKIVDAGGPGAKLLQERATARGVSSATVLSALASPSGPAAARAAPVLVDVLREWLPLVLTLLNESERQRLVADVDPLVWTGPGSAPARPPGEKPGSGQVDAQLERHKKALEPITHADGVRENNYERAIRFMGDCGFLNGRGQDALTKAFEIDRKSQKLNKRAPGAGGFLIQFALDLQKVLDDGDAATDRLNRKEGSAFDPASDNGSFTETIGSHSLMSKDTLESSPFFEDAKVLASVASQTVLHVMLKEVSTPAGDTGLLWQKLLWHLIRYPMRTGGWERSATATFREKGKIPTYTDLPELVALVQSARAPVNALDTWRNGTKAGELEDEYFKLERQVSQYRYP